MRVIYTNKVFVYTFSAILVVAWLIGLRGFLDGFINSVGALFYELALFIIYGGTLLSIILHHRFVPILIRTCCVIFAFSSLYGLYQSFVNGFPFFMPLALIFTLGLSIASLVMVNRSIRLPSKPEHV